MSTPPAPPTRRRTIAAIAAGAVLALAADAVALTGIPALRQAWLAPLPTSGITAFPLPEQPVPSDPPPTATSSLQPTSTAPQPAPGTSATTRTQTPDAPETSSTTTSTTSNAPDSTDTEAPEPSPTTTDPETSTPAPETSSSAPETSSSTPETSAPETSSTSTTTTTTTTTTQAVPTSGPVTVTAAVKRGIVLIEAVTSDGNGSAGTGMLLTSDGQVLTNYHVVRSSSVIRVRLASNGVQYTAKLMGRDAGRDIALLKLQGASGLTPITPAASSVTTGQPVVAAGNAGGQGYLTAYAGQILAKNQSIRVRGATANDPDEDLSGLLETDAHAEPGDSGGPLFDSQRRVVGMTTAGANSSTGTITSAFAVPIGSALGVVDQIRSGADGGSIVIGPKASLGVLAVDGSNGARVDEVLAGTAAEKAGIKAGDTIKSIGGSPVSSLAVLARTLDTYRPGDFVKVSWSSGGVTKSATLVLDASRYN